jgi:hypothetical protein
MICKVAAEMGHSDRLARTVRGSNDNSSEADWRDRSRIKRLAATEIAVSIGMGEFANADTRAPTFLKGHFIHGKAMVARP